MWLLIFIVILIILVNVSAVIYSRKRNSKLANSAFISGLIGLSLFPLFIAVMLSSAINIAGTGSDSSSVLFILLMFVMVNLYSTYAVLRMVFNRS